MSFSCFDEIYGTKIEFSVEMALFLEKNSQI